MKVLVTGGAKRVGAAICRRLSDHDVVVHYHTSSAEAKDLAKDLGGSTIRGDLSSPQDVTRMMDELGKVDALVSNASAFPPRSFKDASWADLSEMMRLHVWAPWAMSPYVRDNIVAIVDTRIHDDDPKHVPYILSKKSLADWVHVAALELAPLRVNGVAPGPILPPTGGSDADFEQALRNVPLGKAGKPEDVAEAVHYLLHARSVTGTILPVDGGRHLGRRP